MRCHILKKPNSWVTGFTLIELLIVLAVIAVLAGLALPNYNAYVLRANRSEAIDILLATAACQERVYTKFHQYDTSRCLENTTTQGGHYVLTMAVSNGNQNYLLTATPQDSQLQDSCGNLTLNDQGERGSSASTEISKIADCWRGRQISSS